MDLDKLFDSAAEQSPLVSETYGQFIVPLEDVLKKAKERGIINDYGVFEHKGDKSKHLLAKFFVLGSNFVARHNYSDESELEQKMTEEGSNFHGDFRVGISSYGQGEYTFRVSSNVTGVKSTVEGSMGRDINCFRFKSDENEKFEKILTNFINFVVQSDRLFNSSVAQNPATPKVKQSPTKT